jgi:hypothetical protein
MGVLAHPLVQATSVGMLIRFASALHTAQPQQQQMTEQPLV